MRDTLFSKQVLPWAMLVFLVFSIPTKAIPWSLESWQGDKKDENYSLFESNFIGEFFDKADGAFAPEIDCLNNSKYPSGIVTAPSGEEAVTVSSCNFGGEYYEMGSVITGTEYQFASSFTGDYLTVRQGTYNGPVVAQGTTPVNYTASSNANLYVHVNSDSNCGTASGCRTTTVLCLTCQPEPCSLPAIDTFPFTETFEADSETRNCWENEYVSGTQNWTFRAGAGGGGSITTAHGGALNASFQQNSYNNAKTKLVSPQFDFSGKENATLNFWYGNQDWVGDQNELRVFYKTSATGAWTMIPGAEYTSSVGAWTEVTFDLPDSNGASEYFIAFEGLNKYARGVVVDDVVIDAEDASTTVDCSSVQTGNLTNGLGNLTTLMFANDFEVASDTEMSVEQVTIRVLGKMGVASTLNFYEDNAGVPGALAATYSNLAPTSQTLDGAAFGFNVYKLVFDLPTPAVLFGDTGGSIFWAAIQVTAGSEGPNVFWETATSVQNAIAHYSSDGGITWAPNGNASDVVLTVDGQCGPITCKAPSGLTASDVTSNTATLSWTEPSLIPDEGYDYYYSTSSTAPDDATTPSGSVATGTSTVDLSGLSEMTTYYAWVRSNCGAFTSPWIPAVFTTPPSLPDYDCYQGDGIVTPVENGNNITASGNFRVAANILVDEDTVFTMKELTFEILSATTITNATINIRANNAGAPGAVEHTVTMAPTSSTLHGTAFSFNVYRLVFELATPIELSEGTYWLEPTMTNSNNSAIYWQQTSSGTHGALTQNSGDAGATWGPSVDGYHSVFFAAGDCDEVMGCLVDFYGQWPSSTVVPECIGVPFIIIANGWTNEYSKVSLTGGVEYTFSSDISTDFITISDENGTEVKAYGTGSLVYTPDADEVVRFYTHADEDCNDDFDNHARIVQCGEAVVIEEPDFDCFQGDGIAIDLPNADGFRIDASMSWRNADDFIVDEGIHFTMQQITIDVLSVTEVTNAVINIREDNGGSPGAVIETVTMAPSSSVTYSSLFGYAVRHLTFDLATPLEFDEGTYWLEPTMTNTGGDSVFWLIDFAGSHGGFAHTSSDSGATWEEDEDGAQAVFFVAGECEEVDEPVEYCVPSSTGTIDYINNFSTSGGITNISNLNSGLSAGGYGDFYDTMGVSMLPGSPVDFSATYVGGNAGFKIWVDLNKDGEFDASEALFVAPAIAPDFAGSITLPAGTPAGDYRMRIRAHWNNQNVQPCGVINWGEAEDYKVTVMELEDCDGTPEGGTATVSPAQGAPGTTYTVSATGFTVGNGLTYQWQSNTDGDGWVDEGTATSDYAPYTATAPAELGISVDWQLVVTCTASGEFAESTTATFTTGVVYCDPSGSNCSDGDLITNVTFEQINNDSGCSPNGYGDYTHLVAGVNAGETYPIEVTVGDGWYERVSVWIDFGNDGSFDPEDYMGEVGDGGQGETLFDFIEIPATVQPGQYRMRIAVGAVGSSNPAPEDPCAPHEFGETEDYTIQVNELGVTDLSSFEFAYYPNPVRDVLNITTKKEVKDVSVFNLTGQKVMSNAKVSQGQIDVTALTPGTYVFRVTLEGGQVETFKIIKK